MPIARCVRSRCGTSCLYRFYTTFIIFIPPYFPWIGIVHSSITSNLSYYEAQLSDLGFISFGSGGGLKIMTAKIDPYISMESYIMR